MVFDNTASNRAAAVEVRRYTNVELVDCAVTDNVADGATAIWLHRYSDSLTVTDTDFSGSTDADIQVNGADTYSGTTTVDCDSTGCQ